MAKSLQFCTLVALAAHIGVGVDAQWAIEDEAFIACSTPDRGVGTCIQIYTCKPIMDILIAVSQPIPSKVKDLLKSYYCGFDGKKPKVCCPSKAIEGPGLFTEKRSPSPPPPPDVSKHRNLHLLPKNCGHLSFDRIIPGNKTRLFDFPWMALLSYTAQRGREFRCAATILNDRYLLTAAHCITRLKYSLLGARIGEHNIATPIDCEEIVEGDKICAPPFQDMAIEEIIPHPEYNPDAYKNNIGLLRVTPMNLSLERVRPVCLPLDEARNYNFTGRNVVVAGWGVTETGLSRPDLWNIQIPVVPFEECERIYSNVTKIHHQHICAGGRTSSDSCADSGGPLHVVTFSPDAGGLVQQGILSFQPKDCGLPGVYTRVSYYMDWILDNIKQ